MAYLVETVSHNGYRCSCCSHYSDSSSWCEELEDAVSRVPTDFPKEDEWGGLYSVYVTDGSTQEVVAKGELTWSRGYGKYSGYEYEMWSGHINGEPFELIRNRGGDLITDKSWDELMGSLKKKENLKKAREHLLKIDGIVKEMKVRGFEVKGNIEFYLDGEKIVLQQKGN